MTHTFVFAFVSAFAVSSSVGFVVVVGGGGDAAAAAARASATFKSTSMARWASREPAAARVVPRALM